MAPNQGCTSNVTSEFAIKRNCNARIRPSLTRILVNGRILRHWVALATLELSSLTITPPNSARQGDRRQSSRRELSDHKVDIVTLAYLALRGWAWLVGGGLIGLLLAIMFLHLATPQYETTMEVTPTSSSKGSRIGALGGLAALSGVSLPGGNDGATPFQLYVAALTSSRMAEELARDPRVMRVIFNEEWDQQRQTWHPSDGLIARARTLILPLFGYPLEPWSPPDAADLEEFLSKRIVITEPSSRDAPITVISFQHKDRVFGSNLLRAMDRIADSEVRTSALTRGRLYSRYLTERLRTASLVEIRNDIAQSLGDQEKLIMMASSNVSFAAIVVEAPSSSRRPTEPNFVVVPIFGVVAGLGFGLGMIFLRSRRTRQSVQPYLPQ
jgi:hypothetical protein